MKTLLTALAFFTSLSGTMSASAQSFPTRPISIVVPFAPGVPTDVIARSLAQHMTATLGQSVIVETQAGANGSTGVGRVARAVPQTGMRLASGIGAPMWSTVRFIRSPMTC